MNDLAGALAMIKGYEGSIPYMYLDSRGFVTVGVGFLLDSAHSAALFNFALNSSIAAGTVPPERAVAAQIVAEWIKISSQPTGHSAPFYEQFTSMKMLDDDVDALLTAKLNRFEAAAKLTFPAWDEFPAPAQLALMDMIYNLGSLVDYPRLIAAANRKDWKTCAAECHRNGPGNNRNLETKNRFLAAGVEPPLSSTQSA